MVLRLTYITIISAILLLTLVVFRVTTQHATVREIHHYHIYNTAVESIAKELLCEHMQEILLEQMRVILHGYKYDAPVFPDVIYFWWEVSPYNLFDIFPNGAKNRCYGNQDP